MVRSAPSLGSAESTLRTGRILCALAVVAYPAYRLAEAPLLDRIDDPLWLRMLMTALVASLLALSFVSAWVRLHFRACLRGFAYLCTAHVFWLLVHNDLDPAVVIGVFVVLASFIAAAPHMMSRVRDIVWCASFVAGASVLAVVVVDQPRVPAAYFLLSVLVISALAFLSVRAQLLTLLQLVESEETLRADVLVRERTAAALRDSEARATALLDANPDVLLRLGPGAEVREVRTSSTEPLGRLLRGHEGERLDRLLSLATPGSLSDAVDRVRAGGAVADLAAEGEIDGVKRFVELRVATASADECLAVVRDVTEEKELESRLRVADRLMSLGTLASGVAHEINNPLAYVIANVDHALRTLEKGPLEPGSAEARDVLDALGEARDGGRRIGSIVASLKQHSRDDGRPLSAVDVHECIDAAVRMLESPLRYRTTLRILQGDVPRVLANAQQLVQVVVNLLTNALDALPDRSSSENHVRVSTSMLGEKITLEVSDDGCGIPEAIAERVFDPFFTTKPPGAGTGLGLYLCHQLVLSFGGSITARSREGEGTTLQVLLCPAVGDVEAVRPSSPVVLPRSRILIVDDEPLVARAMARALGRDDIVMAGDGQRALDLCRAGTFDLILCDVMMPRMDGPAFFVALSAERPELVRRVVFMSGGAFAPAAAAFLERVPNPKLDKPVDVGRLLAVARPIVLARASVPPSGTWSAPPP